MARLKSLTLNLTRQSFLDNENLLFLLLVSFSTSIVIITYFFFQSQVSMILYNFIDTIGSIDAPNTIYVVVEGTKNRLNKVEESFRGGVEVYHSLM